MQSFCPPLFALLLAAPILLASLPLEGQLCFEVPVSYPTGSSPSSVTTGDFDEDGHLDLAVAKVGSDEVSIRLGDGLGGFAAEANYVVGDFPSSVTTSDFNEDGHQDLAVANGGSDDVSILLGDGLGGFTAALALCCGGSPLCGVKSGDFNLDGHFDLAVAKLWSWPWLRWSLRLSPSRRWSRGIRRCGELCDGNSAQLRHFR